MQTKLVLSLFFSSALALASTIAASSYQNGTIYLFDTSGAPQGSVSQGVNGEWAIAATSNNGLVAIGYNDGQANFYSSGGQYLSSFQGLTSAYDIAIDASGNIYASTIAPDMVQVFSPAGTLIRQFTLQAAGQFIEIGPDGGLYAISVDGVNIFRINSITGVVESTLINNSVLPGGGGFSSFAFDSSGNLVFGLGIHLARYNFVSSSVEILVSGTLGAVNGLALADSGSIFYINNVGVLYEYLPNGSNNVFATQAGGFDRLALNDTSGSNIPEPASLVMLALPLSLIMLNRKSWWMMSR